MKKIYLPLALAATLALGACSSDNVVDNGGSNPIDLSKGGFVKMSLNLPTDNNRGSRATHDLNDGLANEYGIKNAYLVLFEGKDEHNKENEATFKGAYELKNSDFSNFEAVGDDPNHVTITKRIAFANGTKPQSGRKLFALVVLNNNGLFTVNATSHELTFATNVTPGEYATTANFANFSKAIASTNTDGTTPFAANVATKGIFMTNAPLCTQPGGKTDPTDAEVKTLADVTNNIYTTEAEAKSKPAAEIYVERAVAKVTVQSKTDALEANKANAASKISYQLYNWVVDNTNKKSYIVRQYNKDWNSIHSDKVTTGDYQYRFVWGSEVNPNATEGNKLYRTSFAQDPEYDTPAANAANYNQMASNAKMTLSTEFGNDHPQYCNENTFKVTAQNQDQTTRVVLGVKLSAPGTTTYDADLYTVNDNKEVVYTKATLAERLKRILLNEPDVKTWADAHTNVSLDITFNEDAAGKTTIKEATLKGKTAASAADETFAGTFTTDFNKALPNIVRYKGGVAYYAVRIKHFGDTEGTPWKVEGQGVTAGGNSLIYPNPSTGNNDGWFLGRYGVVRNNWYDISVNKIQTLGDATIPAFTNDPDDVLENYISVSINVLSWSKHSQSADL